MDITIGDEEGHKMALASIHLEKFVYNKDTVHEDWEQFKDYLNNYFVLANIKNDNDGQAMCLATLMHTGGPKISEIWRSQDDPKSVTFKQLIEILDGVFDLKEKRLLVFRFRNCKQSSQETLQDYVMRLKTLAKKAGLKKEQMDEELLYTIASCTCSSEVRAKALKPETKSVKELIEWQNGRDSLSMCTDILQNENTSRAPQGDINRVKESFKDKVISKDMSQKCHGCGRKYHDKREDCPAYGKKCFKCQKKNHFSSVCTNKEVESEDKWATGGKQNKYGGNKKSFGFQKKAVRLIEDDEDEDFDKKLFSKFKGWLNSKVDQDENNEASSNSMAKNGI